MTLIALACTSFAAACTGRDQSRSPSPQPLPAKPCALLTQVEAASAVGQPLNPLNNDGGTGECSYAAGTTSVILIVGRWDAISQVADLGSAGHRATEVPALGDQALASDGPVAVLVVRKGTTGFTLSMGGQHIDQLPDKGLAKEELLARIILNRL